MKYIRKALLYSKALIYLKILNICFYLLLYFMANFLINIFLYPQGDRKGMRKPIRMSININHSKHQVQPVLKYIVLLM